mgnify:CR=1 FL=1
MNKRIIILEPNTANKIAAGEVVERPASIVKELVENALDAGSSAVTVEIRNGGIDYIRITDNGSGIPSDDVRTAFLRHATSKLSSAEELTHIETFGFRGEALASVAAVSKVSMRTRTEDDESGTYIAIEGGVETCFEPCGCPTGTTIEVNELFFNVPARLKFLKSPRSEAAFIGDYVVRLILANTDTGRPFTTAPVTAALKMHCSASMGTQFRTLCTLLNSTTVTFESAAMSAVRALRGKTVQNRAYS